MAYFNSEGFSRIVFEGCVDADDENFAESIRKYQKDNPGLVRGNPKNWNTEE